MKRKMMFGIAALFIQLAVYGENTEVTTESAIVVRVESGIAIAESTKLKANENNIEKKEKDGGVTKLQEAQIYIEEENFVAAEKSLLAVPKEEKESAEYYYCYGKIEESKGEKKSAEVRYKKAVEMDGKNKYYRLALLNLHIKSNSSAATIQNEVKEILNMNISLSEEDKKELDKIIKGKREAKGKTVKNGNFSTGVVATDNVKETKEDKKSDVGSVTSIYGTIVNTLGNERYMTFAAGYGNTVYFDNSEESFHKLFAGAEYEMPYSELKISIPLIFDIGFKDGENDEYGITTGVKLKKNLKKSLLSYGVDVGYRDNKSNDYSGVVADLYGKIGGVTKNRVNYLVGVILGTEAYDKDEYKNSSIGISAALLKKYGKYSLRGDYSLKYKLYDFEVAAGKDRKDMVHNLAVGVTSQIGDSKWSYGIKYNLEYDDSNSVKYDYIENRVTAEIGREF